MFSHIKLKNSNYLIVTDVVDQKFRLLKLDFGCRHSNNTGTKEVKHMYPVSNQPLNVKGIKTLETCLTDQLATVLGHRSARFLPCLRTLVNNCICRATLPLPLRGKMSKGHTRYSHSRPCHQLFYGFPIPNIIQGSIDGAYLCRC